MIAHLIEKGAALMPTSLPQEWHERTVLRLENDVITITFHNGTVSIAQGESADASSIIKLSARRLCNIINGSIEFMTVWRELAEPSPADKRFILKGSGAKLFALLDGLIKCYQSNKEFKNLLDGYKASLEG